MQEVEPQTLPRERLHLDPDFDYPTHFTAMRFTLAPEPPEHTVLVEDCAEGDHPRQVTRKADFYAPEARNGFCVGIIGGADGPTAIVVGGGAQGVTHAVCSSVHFEAAERIEWRMVFREIPYDAETFDLL